MKFKFSTWRERASQDFDRENIVLTKAGKTFNVYDAIQEAREDTEIYPTLEKYGCIDRMMLDTKGIYEDFTKYGELRELKEQQNMANNMFYNLPIETREKFNNNINTFMKDGEKYLKNLIDEDMKKAEIKNPATEKVEAGTVKGEVNNG